MFAVQFLVWFEIGLQHEGFCLALMVGWPVVIVCMLLYMGAIKDQILVVMKMRQAELLEQLKSKGSQDG